MSRSDSRVPSMRAIGYIVFVGLFAWLGCAGSDSNDANAGHGGSAGMTGGGGAGGHGTGATGGLSLDGGSQDGLGGRACGNGGVGGSVGMSCYLAGCDDPFWFGTECAAVDVIHGVSDCSMPIPPPPAGQTFDENKLNVVVSTTATECYMIGRVASSADCGPSGGWYFDNDTNPTQILLCPASCSIQKMRFFFGCDTIEQPK